MRLLDKILFETVAPRQVRYLKAPDYARADGPARAALDQMDRDFVIGPPVTVHLANPDLMIGMWSAARECLAAGTGARARGEVIAASISRLNACPYCFDIHTSMLHSWGEAEAAQAVLRGGRLPDAEMQRAADWASATLQPANAILAAPPFMRGELPGAVGTALCFHYLNRIANVFLDGSALMVKGQGRIKGAMVAMAGNMLRPRLLDQRVARGEFLTPVSGTLPPEFACVRGDGNIAGGFLRFANAVEAAGEESVSRPVQECVGNYLAGWRGQSPGIGRGWVEQEIATLEEEQRAAARLALLAAVAPWQVDDAVVTAFRTGRASDRDLINTTSWAVFGVVRRIASWL